MTIAIVKGSLSQVAQTEGKTLAETFLNAEIVVLLDNSGSMEYGDGGGGMTRRERAEQELVALQEKHPGEIALVCFGTYPAFSPRGVVLDCGGTTNMAEGLRFIKPADNCGMKVIIITDGEPDSESDTLAVASMFVSPIHAIYCGPEGGMGWRFLQKLMGVTGGIGAKTAEVAMFRLEVENMMALPGG